VLADGNAESPGEELAVQDTNHAIEHYDIVLPVDEKYAHPLSAAYRLSLTDTVQKLVADGERRPRALFDMVRTKRIPTQQLETIDPGLETLMNLNAPQEYADALRRAGFAIPQWVDEAILNSEDK
jgi:molybdopterin-guanine dinucleotide biosynthesis protein A